MTGSYKVCMLYVAADVYYHHIVPSRPHTVAVAAVAAVAAAAVVAVVSVFVTTCYILLYCFSFTTWFGEFCLLSEFLNG